MTHFSMLPHFSSERLDHEGTFFREMHSDHNVKVFLSIINETLERDEENYMTIEKIQLYVDH